MVDKAATTHVHQLYIDPDHVVFDLVPGPLNTHLKECYNELGHPAVTHQTVWAVYLDLLHIVQDHAARLPPLPTAAMIEQTLWCLLVIACADAFISKPTLPLTALASTGQSSQNPSSPNKVPNCQNLQSPSQHIPAHPSPIKVWRNSLAFLKFWSDQILTVYDSPQQSTPDWTKLILVHSRLGQIDTCSLQTRPN